MVSLDLLSQPFESSGIYWFGLLIIFNNILELAFHLGAYNHYPSRNESKTERGHDTNQFSPHSHAIHLTPKGNLDLSAATIDNLVTLPIFISTTLKDICKEARSLILHIRYTSQGTIIKAFCKSPLYLH
jgi:hypothetical protein